MMGVFRHRADSLAWKDFDEKHPNFACDPRNIRLDLASDGFNSFRIMNINHSTWPIVLMVYNLFLWLCMKKSFFILSVLINGPKSLGNKIDVYMQSLIEDLKELWTNDVKTYDASPKCIFVLRAVLLWTISYYPAYEYLSGWGTNGGKKSKDNINTRKDLEKMNIKAPLHPNLLDSGKYLKPLASYTLSADAKDKFLKVRLTKSNTRVSILDIFLASGRIRNSIQDDARSLIYSLIEEELQKKPTSERTKGFKNELFTNAIGLVRNGRVRCMGT
ncbi:hypothetical protein LIER_07782 [Lithospermum erythrorhizon]|uniref:Uncharacterized protein n=1 Tax=Lithospermum erythrorhizon TaxID=34254 RepID=A0AAV3P9J6_LITER